MSEHDRTCCDWKCGYELTGAMHGISFYFPVLVETANLEAGESYREETPVPDPEFN